MKLKNLKFLFLSLFVFALIACADENNSENNDSNSAQNTENNVENSSNIFEDLSILPEEEKGNFVYSNDLHFEIDEKEYVYLVTGTNPDGNDCHACFPEVMIFLLEKNDNQWIIKAKSEQEDYFGAWGEVPPSFLIKIGKDRYAVMLSLYDGNQGYFREISKLYTQNDGKIEIIGEFETGEDNSGAGVEPIIVYYTDLIPIISTKKYFDIELVKTYGAENTDSIVKDTLFYIDGMYDLK